MRGQSLQNKRGIVKENDPKTGRSRVEFQDEDGVSSHWLHWNMPFAGGSKVFAQPDVGSQVNCLLDHHGEQGSIIGATYSKQDKPPTEDGNAIMAALGALGILIDKAGGTITFTGKFKVVGDVDFSGGTVKHNGHDIGDTHKHAEVTPGGGTSGKPL